MSRTKYSSDTGEPRYACPRCNEHFNKWTPLLKHCTEVCGVSKKNLMKKAKLALSGEVTWKEPYRPPSLPINNTSREERIPRDIVKRLNEPRVSPGSLTPGFMFQMRRKSKRRRSRRRFKTTRRSRSKKSRRKTRRRHF